MKALSFIISFVMISSVAANANGACNLRCPTNGGSEIVCEGDTKFDIVRKCGEPDFVEEIGFISSGRYGEETDETEVRRSYREFLRKIEKWYYNCGENRFIKEITFEGNVVVNIDNTDRGSGSQKCW